MDTISNKLIIVLGMHRSGTSVLARGLRVLGVELGENLLPALPGINEKGFWEDVDINSLNIEMLKAVHSDWHFLMPIEPTDVEDLFRRGYLEKAAEILRTKTSRYTIFGFKDPRIAKLLPFWKEVFVKNQLDVSYIISLRNPLSVVASLAARDKFDSEKSYLLWIEHVINSLLETSGEKRVLIDYDRLLAAPEEEISRIGKNLELKVDTVELEKFKKEFLDTGLRHAVHQLSDLMKDKSAPELVKEIYAEILTVLDDEQKLNSPILLKKLMQWRAEYFGYKPVLQLADKLSAELNETLADRNYKIAILSEQAQELSAIKSTRSWRIYTKLIDLFRRLVPVHSLQASILDMVWKGVRELTTNGLKSFIFKSTPHIRGAIWKIQKRRRLSQRKPVKGFIQVEPATVPIEIPRRESSIDIVICVHNALDDVRRCLASIEQFTNSPYQLILVDDGSAEPSRNFLQDFSHGKQNCILLRNEEASGYTRAANKGLHSSTADFVILLNSDTVVGPEWLDRLYAAIVSNDRYGVAGPLSNTASWQSIPKLESNGDWADNPLPEGVSVEEMSRFIAQGSGKIRPEATLLNGFCLMIRRAVIDQIGYLDEELFGEGYGEEDDFNLRARKAGWKLVIADDVYIYHAQSKSYSHERRHALSQRAGQKLRDKHGMGIISDSVQYMNPNRIIEGIRARSEVQADRSRFLDRGRSEFAGKKVLFVLPIVDAGGGGNVVIDEAKCMQRMGVDVTIFNLSRHKDEFVRSYPHLDIPVKFGGEESLLPLSFSYDAMIATANYSVEWLKPVREKNRNISLGYYVQGFEVLMYSEGTADAKRALASYSLIDGMRPFAKTEWVRNTVFEHSGVNIANVGISVNTDLFRPRHARPFGEKPVVIVAMVRPGSPYRNPKLTMDVLRKIERQFSYEVEIRLFGSEDIRDPGLDVPTDFHWAQTGKLTQHQVASLLSDADIFVDFSSHQAMGLTALEAMACGCTVIVPENGGATEFVQNRENGMVVDTGSQEACYNALRSLVENDTLRKDFQLSALKHITQYFPEAASYKILKCLFHSNS